MEAKASLDTWTIIFLVVGIQGLFLAVMIYMRRSGVNYLLGSLILTFSLCLLYYVAFWTRYVQFLPFHVGITQGFTYLFGPLAYLYIRSNKKELAFNAWHLLPYILFVVFFFSRTYLHPSLQTKAITIQVIIQNLHLLSYTALIFHWLQRQKTLQNGMLKDFLWKRKVAWAFFGYALSFLGYYLLVWTSTLKIEYDYAISFASSFFIYFIGYQGFQHPDVLKVQETPRYDRSTLSDSAARSILATIKMHMATQKPYLDSDLKLQQLAEQLSFSAHHISQVINDLEKQNFSDFINIYRVNAARQMLADPTMCDKKIIHVAYDSGFNNKASFNNAFKKFTGQPPSEYRNKQLNPNEAHSN
ncbi:transcriptional regulator, AraC family [Fulvivirga imtechensis AK7]|uniref:Transcriptional regulator, AraC family n=1 Tax=Fulvivirga imtechensis AK7 TaxID=1237149 RepID=L8JVC7_9BACT|nr:helix-turn-helix domain-containing protein [Fulvivirga imtechensis]ELR71559.1 transcriptional regulator, AraC family [Fulvivirga imtechensis AK7]